MTLTSAKPMTAGHRLPGGGRVVRLLDVAVDDAGRIVRTYLSESSDGRLAAVAECVSGSVVDPRLTDLLRKED